MQRTDVEALRNALTLDVDMAWVNHFGEHVWLGPCLVDGVRVGITDCCPYGQPCVRHAGHPEGLNGVPGG